MKVIKVLMLIVCLILASCSEDSSGGSGTVGPPPDWPEDNDSTSA